jgi:hypothetical protein
MVRLAPADFLHYPPTLSGEICAMLRSAAALIAAALSLTPAAAQDAEPAPTRGYNRTEAPEPWRPAGPLHFLGLTAFDEGQFADPASLRRSDGRVEVRMLTVGGQIRHVAEGEIRWTWARLDVDCAGRAWETLEFDAYDTDGTWLAGFAGPILDSNPVNVPSEEALLAYVCDGTRPADFQIVPDQARAVAGIIQAFAGR